MKDLSALLLYPPITDPTSPYHSLIYIASYAKAFGYENIDIRDTNIESLNYCSSPEFVSASKNRWHIRLCQLQRQDTLSQLEQLEYRYLLRGRSLKLNDPQKAIKHLKGKKSFFNYSIYRDSVEKLLLWLDLLSCNAFPGQYSSAFSLNFAHLYNLCSVSDLISETTLDKIMGDLKEYYYNVLFPEIIQKKYELVGINITYTSQLPFALWILKEIRKILPNAYFICGGTEVSDVWKYARKRDDFHKIFHNAQSCMIGEGESGFLKVLDSLSLGAIPSNINNLICIGQNIDVPPQISYENLNSLPAPDYALMDNGRYFAPHKLVYYSPTRGCYWNKCTFCDYGLNFGTPTSPWRQRTTDLIVTDLQAISKITKYVYLSVDVLAPSSILKIAEGIIDRGIEIKWAAEMRLEKYFTAERCRILRKSGCVAVSVGFESGSQRILNLIEKGTDLDHIKKTIKDFTQAGIAVQMMGFTGFPSETYEEANESINFLKGNSSNWATCGLGEFVLTPGSIIARKPEKFDIEIKDYSCDDIKRQQAFIVKTGKDKTEAEKQDINTSKARLFRTDFDRPFVGGIDSSHSIFYYDKFGCDFFSSLSGRDYDNDLGATDKIYSLNGILIDNDLFYVADFFDVSRLQQVVMDWRMKSSCQLTAPNVMDLINNKRMVRKRLNFINPLFIRGDGVVIPCSYELFRFLQSINKGKTLNQILADLVEGDEENEIAYNIASVFAIRNQIISPLKKVSRLSKISEIDSNLLRYPLNTIH